MSDFFADMKKKELEFQGLPLPVTSAPSPMAQPSGEHGLDYRPWEKKGPFSTGQPTTSTSLEFSPEDIYASSPRGKDELIALLSKVEQVGIDALSAEETKRLKAWTEVFPEIGALVQQAGEQAQAAGPSVGESWQEVKKDIPGWLRSLSKEEQEIVGGIGERLDRNVGIYRDAPGSALALVKLASDVVSEIFKPILSELETESAKTPWPVSEHRDVEARPLTEEEYIMNRRWESLDAAEKQSAISKKLGLGAVSGALGFMTQQADLLINPEKYQMTPGEAVDQTITGFADMLANAPDQTGYMAELFFGTPNNPITKAAEVVGTIVNLPKIAAGEKRKMIHKEAVNALYDNPESLPFALMIGRAGWNMMKKRVPGGVGRAAEKRAEALEKRAVEAEKKVSEAQKKTTEAETKVAEKPVEKKTTPEPQKAEKVPEKPAEIETGNEMADTARNLAHTKRYIKETEGFLKRKDVPPGLRQEVEGQLKQAKLEEAEYQHQVDNIKARSEKPGVTEQAEAQGKIGPEAVKEGVDAPPIRKAGPEKIVESKLAPEDIKIEGQRTSVEGADPKFKITARTRTDLPDEATKHLEEFGLKKTGEPVDGWQEWEGIDIARGAPKDLSNLKDKILSIIRPVQTGEPKTIGLDKAEIERIRRDYPGIDELPEAQKRATLEVLGKAKQQGLDQTASELANSVIKSPRPITDVEYAGMTLRAAKLADEYAAKIKEASELIEKGEGEAATQARMDAEGIIRNLDDLTMASDLGGREVARALRIRQMRLNRESYTLASVMQKARAAKGKALSEKEAAKVELVVERHAELEKLYEDLKAKHEASLVENEKLIAEQVWKDTVTKYKRQSASKKSILEERRGIKKELLALGFRINELTGVTAEGSYLIGKLAVNYIKEGVQSLEQVVAKVTKDIPQITSRDVYQGLITKDPSYIKKVKSETTMRVERLKRQAKLLTDIEKAEQGIFEPVKEKQVQPQEIRQLQAKLRKLRSGLYKSGMESARLEKALQTINEIQAHLDNGLPIVKKQKSVASPELQAAREKINNLRTQLRVETELADLNKQLETGEFKVAPRIQTERYLPPELEKAQVELQMARKDVRAAIEALAPMTTKKVLIEGVNTLRTLKATADFSGSLRQGLVLSASRPMSFAKSYGKSFQAFFSKLKAEQVDAALKGADHHWIREKSGLYMAPLEKGAKLSLREEMFMARAIQRIPGIGHVVRASERHMVTFLNMMRTSAFDQFYRKYPNATRAELEAWANWVNVASGRGSLGSARQYANAMAVVMFAPRFTVSRFQTPYMMIKHFQEPRVRKMIAKDMAAVGGVAMTALALADMAGFEVGVDPMEPDFGKIMVGNTRIDIFAGFQQPMRLMTSMIIGGANKAGLTPEWYAEMNERFDPLEAIGRFAQYKLAPSMTVPLELYRGQSIVGEERDISSTMAHALVPMVYEDIWDAYKEAGFGRVALSGGLAFHGIGVNTYADSESKTRRDITKALAGNNFDQAMQTWVEWNMDNPDKKIAISWMMNAMLNISMPGRPTIRKLKKQALKDMAN